MCIWIDYMLKLEISAAFAGLIRVSRGSLPLRFHFSEYMKNSWKNFLFLHQEDAKWTEIVLTLKNCEVGNCAADTGMSAGWKKVLKVYWPLQLPRTIFWEQLQWVKQSLILIQPRLRDRIHTLVPRVQTLQSPETNAATLHKKIIVLWLRTLMLFT